MIDLIKTRETRENPNTKAFDEQSRVQSAVKEVSNKLIRTQKVSQLSHFNLEESVVAFMSSSKRHFESANAVLETPVVVSLPIVQAETAAAAREADDTITTRKRAAKAAKAKVTRKVAPIIRVQPPVGQLPCPSAERANFDQVNQMAVAAGKISSSGDRARGRWSPRVSNCSIKHHKPSIPRIERKGRDVVGATAVWDPRQESSDESSEESQSRSRSRGRERHRHERNPKKRESSSDSDSKRCRKTRSSKPQSQRSRSSPSPPRTSFKDKRAPTQPKRVDTSHEKSCEDPAHQSDDFLVVREPPRFTGESDGPDVEAYKSQARLYLTQLSNQSLYKQMIYLNMMISGAARDIADVHAEKLKSPQDLFDLMTEYFPRGAEENDFDLEVNQRKGELVMSYRARVEVTIARSWLKSLKHKERSKLEVDTFLRGLLPEFYEQLLPRNFSTIKEAAKSAVEIAKWMKETKPRRL